MAIQISTAIAIYFVIWWIALFLTLPFGVRSQHEDGVGAPGTDPGAPILTRMRSKLIWTTIISAIIYGDRHGRPIMPAISRSSACRN